MIFDKYTLVDAFYIKDNDDRGKFEDKIHRYGSRLAIYIVLDVFDVEYVCEFFDPLKKSIIRQLVSNKLKIDLANFEFKNALPVAGGSSKKKLNYVFIGVNINSKVKSYVHYFDFLPYIITGVHIMPIEASVVMRYLAKKMHRRKINSDFQMLVLVGSIVDYKIVVFNKGSFFLSRAIGNIGGENPNLSLLADEINSTINYVIKLYNKTEATVSVYYIVHKNDVETCKSLEIKANDVFIKTLEDCASFCKVKTSSSDINIDNADIIISSLMLKNSSVLKMPTKKTIKVNTIINTSLVLDMFSFVVVILALLMLGVFGLEFLLGKVNERVLLKKSDGVTVAYNSLREQYHTTSDEMIVIDNILKLYDSMMRERKPVQQYIKNISKIALVDKKMTLESFKLDKKSSSVLNDLFISATLDFRGMSYQEASNGHLRIKAKIKDIFQGCRASISSIPIDISDKGIDEVFKITIQVIGGGCYED
ncbi:hypothetical protein [Candidatus Xenohaliotis californiensis]